MAFSGGTLALPRSTPPDDHATMAGMKRHRLRRTRLAVGMAAPYRHTAIELSAARAGRIPRTGKNLTKYNSILGDFPQCGITAARERRRNQTLTPVPELQKNYQNPIASNGKRTRQRNDTSHQLVFCRLGDCSSPLVVTRLRF